jgi:hypothetical protein
MSIMDNDKLPKRPVVSSKAAADAEFEYWLKENNFDHMKDGDGLPWKLELKIARVPEPAKREAPWTLTLHLTAQVTAKTLVETHTLEPEQDSRLIEMMGDHVIDINLKPVQRKAMTREDARRMLAVVLPETRDKVALSSFREIKRSLVGRWIDQSRVFGAQM